MTASPPPPTHVPGEGSRTGSSAHDRGVSEVVSFILTFSIITMMIGLLYTAGFVSMEKLQTGNQMQNAEGVFFAMSENFRELQEGQAPKRAGALDLDVGASITVGNDSQIEIAVNNATGPVFSRTVITRSLDYRLDRRTVSYENGAVFRANRGNSAMVLEPAGILCSPTTDSAVVSLVTLVDTQGASVASGTVTVSGLQRSTGLLYPTDRNATGSIENVTIDVTSSHATAWDEHLAEDWADPDGDGTFACDAEQVFVRHTVVEVHLEA